MPDGHSPYSPCHMAMRYQTAPDVCYQQQGYNQHMYIKTFVYRGGPQTDTTNFLMLKNYIFNPFRS